MKGGPRGWDALTYLCFSRYLRLDRARAGGFLEAAEALLDAGADANTGFQSHDQASLEFESVLYGAAGVAHDGALTRLLVERGANPNDGEVMYHTPETYDNAALRALLASDRVNDDSLASMLLRKHDWHDAEGIALLIERGADPNRLTRWGYSALHQAIRRDNAIEIIEFLLDHGANPLVTTLERRGPGTADTQERSAVVMAAWEGRGDVLDLFERRGAPIDLQGVEALLAACARHDAARVHDIAGQDPECVRGLRAQGGAVLAEFAGIGNTDGVRHLLDLGVDVNAVGTPVDGYWGIAKDSTALHVAAWRARHETVKLLIERGAAIDVADGKGRTPLALAMRACVDSYWTDMRSPESVAALLAAGASVIGVPFPSGYADVDTLLRQHGAGA